MEHLLETLDLDLPNPTTAPPESLAAAYIASRLEECLHKVALIRSISEDALPAEETSAKILAISRCSEALPPIDIDETFLNVLNLDTVLDFVLSLAADPLGTDVGAYIAKGVLHKVADTLKVHGTVQYYVREYPFPDARVFVHQMQTYALTFPHDSPWALSSLIVAGYPQAATELLQTLAETIGATIPSICLLQFKRPSQLSLKYIGMTSAQTLHERSHDDLGGATTRLRNFSKCNGWDQEDVLIFEIPSLALTNVDAFAERTDARVGPREEWLIGRLPVGLNVAPGHVKLFFDAPPDIRDCFARIERRVPPLPHAVKVDEELISRVVAAERDQIQFWRTGDFWTIPKQIRRQSKVLPTLLPSIFTSLPSRGLQSISSPRESAGYLPMVPIQKSWRS